ncbi:MAG TPA: hypothetical protein VFW29_12615 [Solirubrobacteraceae bacterium]|nr:hypothetical protein [Solirubrobacteraceae bacterium]
MLLALATAAIVLVVLVWELARPRLSEEYASRRELRARRRLMRLDAEPFDPGRERRAEQRARELLRSCVEEQDWEMYRDLGFLRVWGAPSPEHPRYAYLIYPHKPLVAFVAETGELLSEYCVAFPDDTRPYGSARLPDADDVLAKWMALAADERGLIAEANMHLPGRQVDPDRVRNDLARLAAWERAREGRSAPPRAGIAPDARAHVTHGAHGMRAA